MEHFQRIYHWQYTLINVPSSQIWPTYPDLHVHENPAGAELFNEHEPFQHGFGTPYVKKKFKIIITS